MEMPGGSINLKTNRPEPFDGRRDYLVVHTWLYKVEQYLALTEITNPNVGLSDQSRIMYASTFLAGTAAVWWYTMVQSNQTPATWADFKVAITREFVPEDHVRRARDKLRKLRQTGSVSKYLSEFRNLVLTIPDVTDGEKWDRFCSGLKYDVRLEVIKSSFNTFEEAAQLALSIDSAIYSAKMSSSHRRFGTGDVAVPMEIGNVETKRGPQSSKMSERRTKDLQNNACFTCHRVGCRPWKHGKKKISLSNVEFVENADDGSGEESDTTESEN